MTEGIRVWRCGNCGYEVPIPLDGSVEGLSFQWYSNRTSKVGCKACGSYTIQQAYDDSFTAGNFLIVRSKRLTYGKGNVRHEYK